MCPLRREDASADDSRAARRRRVESRATTRYDTYTYRIVYIK